MLDTSFLLILPGDFIVQMDLSHMYLQFMQIEKLNDDLITYCYLGNGTGMTYQEETI